MTSHSPELPEGAAVIGVVSAAMIAQQVAGKATRDALYLTNYDVTTLPLMMAASAALSIFAVFWLSKMMLRHSPARVVPASFALSGVGLLAAWLLSFTAPQLAAIAVYLHSALFGASLISAFWSFVNERFDPHAGKRAVTFIAGGGTLGGVLGGVIAWRASSLISVPTMLPLLAAINFVCLWGSLRSRDSHSLRTPGSPVNEGGPGPDAHDAAGDWVASALSSVRVLRGAPYLKNLALVTTLGAVTTGLLDYLFRLQAVNAYARGPELLSFFALFWIAVGALSFALQLILGRITIERLGLGVTIALLPGVVALGGIFALAVPGLWSTAILRGGEAAQRNSLFRSAYELLYSPLSSHRRRSTKLLVDVGFDRLGTVAASAIVLAAHQLERPGEQASGVLLVLVVASALVTLTRTRALQTNYVAELEGSLRRETEGAKPRDGRVERSATRESGTLRDRIVDQLQDLPRTRELAARSAGRFAALPLEALVSVPADVVAILDESLQGIRALSSGSPQRIHGFLRAGVPLTPPLVPLAIQLLGSAEYHRDAIQALRRVAHRHTGQLGDSLGDATVGFDVRRRLPRVLSACPTQAAADALISGTADERFEVRYECGRALLRITAAEPKLVIALETVIAIVRREAARSKEVWLSQQPDPVDEDDRPSDLIGRLLRDRFDRSFEHVFSILALALDRESLRIVFEALHQRDSRLRGTALEYLEALLPDEVRDVVWPFLGEAHPMRPARPAEEILLDLLNAREMSKTR